MNAGNNDNTIKIQLAGLQFRIKTLVIPIIFTLLLIPLMLIPSVNELFVDWIHIPAMNWLRLVSAIIITSFLPGFFVLKLIVRNNKLSTLATIALSYIISMFITPLLHFIAMIFSRTSTGELFLGLMVGCILTSYIILLLTENKQTFRPSILIHDRISLSILVFVFMLWLFGFLNIYINSQLVGSFFFPGVNQNHLNWALSFTKGFSWWLSYPWWFHAYLASFFTLSGFPLINAYLVLSIFSPITVLFIYLVGIAFLRNKKIAAFATAFASFQGFGWIYFILSRLTSNEDLFKTLWDVSSESRDIIAGIALPNTFSPIFFVGIPAFLALFFVIYSDELSVHSKYILVALLTSLLYLSHGGYEVLLFASISLLFCIFDVRTRTIDFPLGILLGLSFVALIDVISPFYSYIMFINTCGTSFWTPSPVFIYSILLSVVTYIILRILRKRNINVHFDYLYNLFSSKTLTKQLLFLVIFYLYVMFWLTWIRVLPPSFDENNVYIYSYPMRFGVNMVLAILGFYLLFNEEHRELRNSLSLLLLCSVALALLAPFLRQIGPLGIDFPWISEHRLNTFSLIFISFVSSYTFLKILYGGGRIRVLFKLFDEERTKKLLTLLIILGILSTTFYFYGWSLFGQKYRVRASSEELEGLNYLRVNVELDKTVLTISGWSRDKIATYTGLVNPMLYQIKGEEHWKHLLSASSPEIVFYLLNKYRVKYIYLTPDDLTLLEKEFSDGFLISLIKSLPVFFKNDYVTILEIPDASYPVLRSTFNIITPLEAMPSLLDLYASFKSSENLQISNCDTLGFVGTTRAQVVIDTEDKKEGNASIKATATGPTSQEAMAYFITGYMPQKYREVDGWEKLFFWFKSPVGNITVEVGISTWGTGQSFWRFTYRNPGEWQGVIVPLKEPDGYYSSFADYKNVSLIAIKVCPPLTENMTFYIDDLFLSSYTYDPIITSYKSLILLSSVSQWNYSTSFALDPLAFGSEVIAIPFDPSTDTYGYLEYAERGGKLLVFDTIGHGFFSKILSVVKSPNSTYVDTIILKEGMYKLYPLKVPVTLALDTNTSVLAFWSTNNSVKTPFVFFRPYGNGGIYLIEVPFLPSLITDGTPQMLNNVMIVGDALNDLLPEMSIFANEGVDSVYDYKKEGLSWFSYTTDNVTVSGLINVESEGLIFPNNLTNLRQVWFSNHEGKFSLQNSSILSLKVIGRYKIELPLLQAVIEKSEVPTYLSINVQEPHNVTLLPLDGGEIHMVIERNGLEEEIVAKELYFNPPMNSLLVRSPLLSFEGRVSLRDTWIWPGNKVKAYGESLELEGKGIIQLVLAEHNLVYLSNLDFEGKATMLEDKPLREYRNEMKDLSETLNSNIGLLASAVFILLLIKIIYTNTRRYEARMKRHTERISPC